MRYLITGAASGIGRSLAAELLADGHTVVGIDVDAAATQQAEDELGGGLSFIVEDLAREGASEALAGSLAAGPTWDGVVHSAGISAVGRFLDSDPTRLERVITINFRAPLLLTAALLARNLISPGGSLVFVSSLSRFVGYPGAAVYAATKDGLASYARSLAVALAPDRINVLTVYPGPTRTPHARRYSPPGSREERRMPPEQVAKDVIRAMRRGRRTLIPGLGNKLAATLGWWLPGVAEHAMRKAILEKL